MSLKDTIVALSTPFAKSALALLRISGDNVKKIIKSSIKFNSILEERKATLGKYLDDQKNIIDEIIFIFYKKNKSYTGEDMLEITCHGNILIIEKILENLKIKYCRIAEPGEFTKRAFLNGKMNISQAEAVKDIIDANNDIFLNAAQNQLIGIFNNKIENLIIKLLENLSILEAYIDFPEEDLPEENFTNVISNLKFIQKNIINLKNTFELRRFFKEGFKIVIVGPPNVGKSSLFNKLLGSDRAIISDIPGTTRDFIKEHFYINKFSLEILDTAGIRKTKNKIEKLGIQKSLDQIKNCDILFFVTDPFIKDISSLNTLIDLLDFNKTFWIQNKIDLIKDDFSLNIGKCNKFTHIHKISLKNEQGLDELKLDLINFLNEKINNKTINNLNIIINSRQLSHLNDAENFLNKSIEIIENNSNNIELATYELYLVNKSLEQIIGKNILNHDTMLDYLFKSFCIGK